MKKITLDDMIKALKCVASKDAADECYADHENFMYMDDEHKSIVCGTGEDLRDHVSGKKAVGCPYYQDTYGCCFEDGESYWLKDVAELLEELKSYKEAEEQGLLVRLPCKVGDMVWELCLCDDGDYKIFPMIVKTISEYGALRQAKKDITIWNIYAESDYTYMYKSFADFGRTVFSTKEEAEKKLEEMKNEWLQRKSCRTFK
jgi:hypothetical protein